MGKNRFLALALFAYLLTATTLSAEIRSTYWGGVDTSNQTTLQQTVYETIRNHNLIPYTTVNWPILEAADENPSEPGHILDFYKNESYEITGHPRPYNREHVWPQSRGFPQGGDWSLHPRADLHNLYLCDVGYNSSRSNNYFDDCDINCEERETAFNNGVGGGTGVYPGNSNWRTSTTWRVWDDRKGDAARAVMYMAARYNGGTNIDGSPEPDLRLTDNVSLINPHPGAAAIAYMGLQSVMLDWHYDDLPDSKEIFRHEVIYGAQLNRNPFIDFPEWADCFFLGDCTGVAPMTPQNVLANNDGVDVTITWSPRVETDLDGYHVYRSETSGSGYTRLTTTPIATTTFVDDTINPMDLYYYVVTAIDTSENESINSIEVTSQDAVGVAIVIPTGTMPPYTQDFDGLGTLQNATLPDHFRVAKSTNVRETQNWADGTFVTEHRSGDNMSGSATNGIYNFGAGPTLTATDRALGFISSGSATRSGAIMAEFTNTSGDSIERLLLDYDVEKYRNGTNTAGFSIFLHYSLDGENWSAAPGAFTVSFPGSDPANAGFEPAPGAVVPVSGELNVSIPNNGTLYLQWLYSVTTGTTSSNAQALAVDNISVFGLTNEDITTLPVIASTTPEENAVLNALPSVSITFSKPVENVVATNLTVDGSSATSVTGNGAGPYVFSGYDIPEDGEVTIALASGSIVDLAGNSFAGDSFTIDFDTVAPEIVAISSGISGLVNTFPTEIVVTMSKPLDEFDPEAIVVNGVAATTITGSGTGPYTFGGYPIPAEGPGTVVFDGLRMTDVAGNAAINTSYNFTLDTTPPTIAVITPAADALLTALPSVTVEFSEDVTGVAAANLTVNGSQANSLSGSGDGPYIFSGFDAPGDGPISVVLASGSIEDLAGNAFAGDSWSYTLDSTPPTIAVITPAADSMISALPSVTVEFSEDVTGVAAANLTVNGSQANSLSGSGDGPYIFSGFDAPDDGPVSIVLASGSIEDLAGNAFAGDSWSYTMDTEPIPVIISSTTIIEGSYSNNSSVPLLIEFDEPVTGFVETDLAGSNYTVDSFGGTGATYNVTINPTSEGPVTVTVPGNSANAIAAPGNPNSAASFAFTHDTTPPVTTLVADATHVVGTEVGFTYSVVEDNVVSGTVLLVRAPGSGSFESAPADFDNDAIVYTATTSGLHEFLAISDDTAGNLEAIDTENAVAVVVNTTENGPLTLDVATGADVELTFPMATGINVTISLGSVTTAGTITMERIIGDLNAVSLGLDPNRLAGQVYLITADGGLDFSNATLTFEIDEAHFGSELTAIDRVFVNRGGILTEITGANLTVVGSTVTVAGVDEFSEWYFGDSTTDVTNWILLID